MSQHRQDTPREPSVWWIVLYATAAGITIGLVLAVIGEDTWSWVHLVAVLFGIFTAAVFVGLTGHKILQRGEARLALIRQEEREHRSALEENARRAAATGTWRGDSIGQVLTVRWDAATRTYWVQGWLSDFWQQREERPWSDLETLAATLTELETTDELRPLDDEGTRMVRSRLDLPGWDQYGTAEPVRQDPADTLVISSPVALRPIGVPVWRGEDTEVIERTGSGLPRREPGAGLLGDPRG